MKRVLFLAMIAGFTAISFTAGAQQEQKEMQEQQEAKERKEVKEMKERKESQDIIIHRKGDKDVKVTVEVKGDNITINGKPIGEFKDDNVTINKRSIVIRDGHGKTRFEMAPDDFNGFSFGNDDNKPHTFLGVTTDKVDDGAKVTGVTKESAAEKAGLKEGDIITKIGDTKIEGPESLSAAILAKKAKDEVKIYYKRDGKESSTKATLGERKESISMAYSFTGPDGKSKSFNIPRTPNVEVWGDKSPDMPNLFGTLGDNYQVYGDMFPRQQKLGLKIQDTEEGGGVKVLSVDKDSPAEKAGLKEGDVLTEVGGTKVNNTDEAREQLHQNQEKNAYTIKAKRNGSEMSFDIKIPKKLKTANL